MLEEEKINELKAKEEEKINELKAKHGEVSHLEIAGVDFYFAKGPKGCGERYLDRTLGDNCSGQAKREAVTELAHSSLVHPDRAALSSAISDEPFVVGNDLFAVLGELYGMKGNRKQGKL